MAYSRTRWQNNQTKLNATNLNNMEDGIEEALSLGTQAGQAATNANTNANKANQDIQALTEAFNNFIITFVGTREEYETANKAGQIPSGILVIITDEEEEIPNSSATTAVLGTATLGSMILGQA